MKIPAIYLCGEHDRESIRGIINRAAVAYVPIMGPDFNHCDYMAAEHIAAEMAIMDFYGARDSDKLVAVMGYQHLGDVGLVRHAYVLPEYQRRGFGSSLIDCIEKRATEDGCCVLMVGTYAENHQAIDFYRGHGFQPTINSQELLSRYWDISQCQAANSTVLAKTMMAGSR